LRQHLGFGVPSLLFVQGCEVIQARGHRGLVSPDSLLLDRERAFLQRLGLAVSSLGIIEEGKVVEPLGDFGMVYAKRLLHDCDSALVRCFRLRILPLIGVDQAEIVEVVSHVCVSFTGFFYQDRLRPLVKVLGLRVFALVHVHDRQVVDDPDKLSVLRTVKLFIHHQRLLVMLFSFSVVPYTIIGERQVVNGGIVICVGGAKPRLGDGLELFCLFQRRRVVARLIQLIESPLHSVEIALLRRGRQHGHSLRNEKRRRQRYHRVSALRFHFSPSAFLIRPSIILCGNRSPTARSRHSAMFSAEPKNRSAIVMRSLRGRIARICTGETSLVCVLKM
jgi:hypothetical protein